jgi:hypothetical protein
LICQEKQRLVEAYQYVTEKHSDAVTELRRTIGTLSKADYDSLYRMTEALRAEVTRVQGELQSHINAHHC